MITSHILIIGAMKSGTTTLFDALARHPAIAPCAPKEPGFFAFEEIWAQGFDWYDALFPFDPQIHRYALDGSTDYTKRPFCTGVYERIEASAPREFHLIYIMRDPVRRLESHARHTQFTRCEVGRFPSPRADHSLDAGLSPVNLAASRYAYQLEPYRPFFDRGRLHLTTIESLNENFENEIKRILDFLDLSEDPNVTRTMRSNAASEKTKANRFSKKLRYSRKLNFLPSHVRKCLAKRMEAKASVPGRFQFENEEIDLLRPVFESELEKLESEFRFMTPEAWRSRDVPGSPVEPVRTPAAAACVRSAGR